MSNEERLNQECMDLVRAVGERDSEIARLRAALGAVVVSCDEVRHCARIRGIREGAVKALDFGYEVQRYGVELGHGKSGEAVRNIELIPLLELIDDLATSAADLEYCRLGAEFGVLEIRGTPIREREAGNRAMMEAIKMELRRRLVEGTWKN